METGQTSWGSVEHRSPAWEGEVPIDSLLRWLGTGRFNPEMSDRTLIVADPGTGRLEMIPVRRVRSVGERTPFEGGGGAAGVRGA